MPVRKFRTAEELNQPRWLERGTPRLWQAMHELARMAEATVGHRFPPGVYKHRSLEEAALLRQAWEGDNVARYQRRPGATPVAPEPDAPSRLWHVMTGRPREPFLAALRASFCGEWGAAQLHHWRAAGCPMTVAELIGAVGHRARRGSAEELLCSLAEELLRLPDNQVCRQIVASLRTLVPQIEDRALRDRLASDALRLAEGLPLEHPDRVWWHQTHRRWLADLGGLDREHTGNG